MTRSLRSPLIPAFLAALVVLPTVISAAGSAHASGDAGRGTWLPPAYLMWRTGGLPSGLAPELAHLAGVERVVLVAGDTLWMTRSVRSNGTVIDRAPLPYRIPIEVMGARAGDLSPFLPGAWRDVVSQTLREGRAVIGETSARLRRASAGDRIVFKGGDHLTIGAVVPDEVASWSELLVSREAGRPLGIKHDRFALLDMKHHVAPATLARRIDPLLGAGYPPRVRAPGTAEFRRQGDSVWPPVLMKRWFGEFSAYPDPRRPGYLRMNPAFVNRHLVVRTVPLLGRFTCHARVFPALIRAMKELRRRGHADAIRNFAGCYNARMVMRIPTGAISHHSWGAAVDINSLTNPYGAPPRQPAVLVRVMRANGFTWGGRWTVPDAMHFEFVRRSAPASV